MSRDVVLGTNDLAAQWEAAEIVESLRTLHELCWSRGLRTVALSVPPNMATASAAAAHASYRETHTSVNRHIAELAAASDGRCVFVDTSELVPWGAAGCCELRAALAVFDARKIVLRAHTHHARS
jgi:hypothetical protein